MVTAKSDEMTLSALVKTCQSPWHEDNRWPTFCFLLLVPPLRRLPHPSRFSKGGQHGRQPQRSSIHIRGAHCDSVGSRTFGRYRFFRILINPPPRLPPQPPRFHVLHQQRRRTIFLS